MIVNSVISMMIPREEFNQFAAGIVKKWQDAVPNERHVHDRVLVFGTVKGVVMQQIAIVTPEGEKTVEELIEKYLAGDYTRPEKDLNIFELLGYK